MTDAAHFTETYRQHGIPIYRFALHMSGSETVAEEVTQDVFLTLIRQPGGFDAKRGTMAAYLYGIARNLVLRHLEQERRFRPVDEDGEAEPFCCDGDLLEDLTRSENIQAVQEAVLRLPEKYREAVVLCDLQEVSYEAASKVLGCAVGTVRSRLHRGRGLLITRLQKKLQARCAI
ncbi:MAG: RNA polymerase sigma factor [Acidobacteriota bacterium]|nr:RNA polymerase sigma factor [Acidobacteriota bacterium]